MEIQNLRDMVRGEKSVFVAKSNERAMRRTMNQPKLGLEYGRASTFGSDQSARNVKATLWKELIEVVPGDAPGNAGETRANQSCILIADCLQLGVNLAAAPTLVNDAVKLGGGGGFYCELAAVIQQNLQFLDVVNGLATEERMRAAG